MTVGFFPYINTSEEWVPQANQDALFQKFTNNLAWTTDNMIHTGAEHSLYYATRTTEIFFHLKKTEQDYDDLMNKIGGTTVNVLWIEDPTQLESIVQKVFTAGDMVTFLSCWFYFSMEIQITMSLRFNL